MKKTQQLICALTVMTNVLKLSLTAVMNCLVWKKIISYTVLIFFALPVFIKCDNCTVQAICECIAKNASTKFNLDGDGFLEGHLTTGNDYDLCHPPTTTVAPTKAPVKQIEVLKAPSTFLINQTTTHFVLSCDAVDIANKSTLPKPTKNGTFILSLNYPCKVPVPEKHEYSTGSVIVIIFFTFVFAYLGLGIAVRFFLIGARGVEVLPHLDFWKDFPALIRDGAKFLQNGCTARPSDVATASPEGYDAI